MTATSGAAQSAAEVRLRYNHVFLPEYVSTVILSILISSFFLSTMRIPPAAGTDYFCAAVIYIVISGWLIWQTIVYRVQFSDVLLRQAGGRSPRIRVAGRWHDLDDVLAIEEYAGGFFGRSARCLRFECSAGLPFFISESLLAYDDLKSAMTRAVSLPIERSWTLNDDAIVQLQQRWRVRHELLPPANDVWEMTCRFGYRIFCLLPVFVVDVLINIGVAMMAQHVGQRTLMVYVVPATLGLSAIVARYVYYFLFTSTFFNRRFI